jgi:hypothetical protein
LPKGCGAAISSSKVQINAANPWAVIASNNVENGWIESVCLQCVNALLGMDMNKEITVTQFPNCYVDADTPHAAIIVIPYVSSPT